MPFIGGHGPRAALAGALLCIVVLAAHAEFEVPPRPSSAVHDGAGVLRPDDARAIEALSRVLWERARVGLVVATIQDLGGEPVEEVAIRIAKSWGVGGEKEDRGILILAAVADRRARVEVGYGAEGFIPDGLAGEILDRQMLPRFREGDFSSGMRQAAERVAQLAAREYGFTLEGIPLSPGGRERGGGAPGRIVGLLVLAALVVLGIRNPWLLLFLLAARGRGSSRGGFGRGWFGGGRMGGGFGGFGGGSFGGGGASRGW